MGILTVRELAHTMGKSLRRYLDIKIHPLLQSGGMKEIYVVPEYNREDGISAKEKTDKEFNYKRPTATLDGSSAKLLCFPGYDYVFHYSNIISTYFHNYIGQEIPIKCRIPSESECVRALKSHSFLTLPVAETVIVGYVQGLDFLSNDVAWNGSGDFRWKQCAQPLEDAILVGVKHTLWGEIAGRLVRCLAERGVQRVIYTGKLGTLCPDCMPNEYIATGNRSLLPDGHEVVWENLFDPASHPLIQEGSHITVPSVLQETEAWRQFLDGRHMFVDPEIGHMGKAAKDLGIFFSYLHIVSDNLAIEHEHDLSNERKMEVIEKRRELLKVIGGLLQNLT